MRSLLASLALGLALLAGVPGEASCAQDIAAPSVSEAAALPSAATVADDSCDNCQNAPCADGCQVHASCGCMAHPAVTSVAFAVPKLTNARLRISFDAEAANGRSLLPPVPPPLA